MKTTRRNFAKALGAAALAGPALQAATKSEERRDAALKQLRDVKLTNSDEPDFTFSALAKR